MRSSSPTCDPGYKEEAVYAVARQLLWNMTQSRTLFLPDFIGLLHRFEADFRLNRYLKEDKQAGKILDYLDKPVIPDTFICAHCRRELPTALREAIRSTSPRRPWWSRGEDWLARQDLPPVVREAAETGRWEFVEEYLSLLALWEQGGMVLRPQARPRAAAEAPADGAGVFRV